MSEKYYSDQEEIRKAKKSDDRRGINIGLILFIIGLILAIIGAVFCHNTDLNKYYKTKDYENSFSASSVKNIDFENNVGDVIIKKAPGSDITITAKTVSEDFKAEVTGDTLVINSPKTKHYWLSVPWFNPENTRVEIALPEKEYDRLTINGGVGDIELSELKLKTISFETGTGDVKFTDITGEDVIINNGVGDFVINKLSCDLFTIDTGTGDIKANGIKCRKVLDIDSGVGDITITDSEAGGLQVDTGTGNTTFKGTINGNIDIDAGVGDVELALTNPETDFGKSGRYTMTIDKGVGEKEVTYNN